MATYEELFSNLMDYRVPQHEDFWGWLATLGELWASFRGPWGNFKLPKKWKESTKDCLKSIILPYTNKNIFMQILPLANMEGFLQETSYI